MSTGSEFHNLITNCVKKHFPFVKPDSIACPRKFNSGTENANVGLHDQELQDIEVERMKHSSGYPTQRQYTANPLPGQREVLHTILSQYVGEGKHAHRKPSQLQ